MRARRPGSQSLGIPGHRRFGTRRGNYETNRRMRANDPSSERRASARPKTEKSSRTRRSASLREKSGTCGSASLRDVSNGRKHPIHLSALEAHVGRAEAPPSEITRTCFPGVSRLDRLRPVSMGRVETYPSEKKRTLEGTSLR